MNILIERKQHHMKIFWAIVLNVFKYRFDLTFYFNIVRRPLIIILYYTAIILIQSKRPIEDMWSCIIFPVLYNRKPYFSVLDVQYIFLVLYNRKPYFFRIGRPIHFSRIVQQEAVFFPYWTSNTEKIRLPVVQYRKN